MFVQEDGGGGGWERLGRGVLREHSTLTTAWCEGGGGRGDGVGRCGCSQGEGHWEQAQSQPAPVGREVHVCRA